MLTQKQNIERRYRGQKQLHYTYRKYEKGYEEYKQIDNRVKRKKKDTKANAFMLH